MVHRINALCDSQVLHTLEDLSVCVGRCVSPKNSAWHFKLTPQDDKQLRQMNSPALQPFKAHHRVLTYLSEHEMERERRDQPPVVGNAVSSFLTSTRVNIWGIVIM